MYPASVEYLNRQRIIPNWGAGRWEQWYIYFFPLFSFSECVCVCFSVWFCLYSFTFTICPRVLSLLFFFLFYYLKQFFLNNYFFILITLFYFTLFYFILFYLLLSFFFLPFILSRVEDRPLVLQPGNRALPLRWETQVQDTGPQETSQLHIFIKRWKSPRDLHLNA